MLAIKGKGAAAARLGANKVGVRNARLLEILPKQRTPAALRLQISSSISERRRQVIHTGPPVMLSPSGVILTVTETTGVMAARNTLSRNAD